MSRPEQLSSTAGLSDSEIVEALEAGRLDEYLQSANPTSPAWARTTLRAMSAEEIASAAVSGDLDDILKA